MTVPESAAALSAATVVPAVWWAVLSLSRQVRELSVARDDLLDAASIHTPCVSTRSA
ncbi:hypothetical protein HLB23_28765 [Nocardia uniformis]|uniref:Uncharacterized protein n=1 Tax=Nocardia uniformis TaxID=53432 RepID=A0A849CEJ9_9NOCA|nr:hypothetical protein [Nocardia uniformis]NNH73799.1 hypothetical protein [Nocardia uniformis]